MASFSEVKSLPSRLGGAASRTLSLAIAITGCTPTAADTVDLGDHLQAPELALDEDFFYCSVQPRVLTEYRCAAGDPSDGGGCHAQKSALRLIEVKEDARCKDGRVIGTPPAEAQTNLARVLPAVGVDPLSSPLYARPLGLASHPRVIFDEGSEPAQILRDWLSQGAP